MKKAGRNDPCSCGSGMKQKHCCLGKVNSQPLNSKPETVSIPETLRMALDYHRTGDLCRAKTIYRNILQISPGHPDVLHYLGVLLHQQGQNENAVELIGKAIVANPSNPTYYSNQGLALKELGKLEEAVACYRQALALKPDYPEAHYNLGIALKDQGHFETAITSYTQALSIKPDYVEAHNNLGVALKKLGKIDAAIVCYRQALAHRPDYIEVHHNLGNALNELERREEALACYRQIASLNPADGTAMHMISALTGGHSEAAPHDYVENVFDGYADDFDSSLVGGLEYRSPEILAGLVGKFKSPTAVGLDILDLGCGTGLMGTAIRRHARKLVGVDLSARMLAKAGERNLYQRLEKSDLRTMMQNEAASSYDLIVAADVFIYIGKLDEIVREGARLLRPGAGLLAFSVEALESIPNGGNDTNDGGYKLNANGRYAHSSAYLQSLSHTNGFSVLALERNPMRLEKGKPVEGWFAIFKRAE